MRPDLEQYYLIDQYLENKLQGEELAAFENQMKADLSFANQVQEQQMLNSFILEAELKDMRMQMEKDLLHLNKPSFFRTYWKWIGLSTVSVLGLLFYTFNSTNKEQVTIATEQKNHVEQRSTSTPTDGQVRIRTKGEAKKNNTILTSTNSTEQAARETIEVTVQQQAIVETPIQQHNTTTNPVETPSIEVKESVDTKKVDCSTVQISFTLKPQATCQDEQEGIIDIESIHGGVAPYTYLVDNKKVRERKIMNLGAGTYAIKIADKNGCTSEQKTIVSEKNCIVAIQQQNKFNVNPSIGEACQIPFNSNKTGNLTVYNRAGKTIYRVTNNSNDIIEWNGTDGYGSLVEQGLYVYIIEYTDGTKESGEVNIVR